MTEEHSEDNLAARAEAYLSQAVLRHPGEATKALKSCEDLLPHAEELGIVARCVEAIAARSSATSLPADKGSGSVVTAKFLFALLRTAHILRASDAARAAIERKAATQLEQATVEDVLIPSYSGAAETLYDVDCVERVVRHFLAEEEVGEDEASSSAAITEEEAAARTTASRPSAVAMTQVGKLVDNYLAEVASDANLKPAKFCELALA
uniref:NPH3 domain-containing protein n=1 Tax=Aegilops tauschii subsp. strangulata TaxID=200361 RepID=A0A453LRN0_AEGTS